MDFAKFVSMISQQGLFFVRCSLLADRHEGAIPAPNVLLREATIPGKALDAVALAHKSIRQWTMVNCWHMNEVESVAMWDLYAGSDRAIAVQSTYEKLRNCLDPKILCGEIRYIDYQKDFLNESYPVSPFICKRKSFKHERELRAIIDEFWPIVGEGKEARADLLAVPKDTGRLVPVNLGTLIENIYVSPFSPDWYFEAVKTIIARFGLSCNVCRSSLEADPLY